MMYMVSILAGLTAGTVLILVSVVSWVLSA